jgi:hypothetical protein
LQPIRQHGSFGQLPIGFKKIHSVIDTQPARPNAGIKKTFDNIGDIRNKPIGGNRLGVKHDLTNGVIGEKNADPPVNTGLNNIGEKSVAIAHTHGGATIVVPDRNMGTIYVIGDVGLDRIQLYIYIS